MNLRLTIHHNPDETANRPKWPFEAVQLDSTCFPHDFPQHLFIDFYIDPWSSTAAGISFQMGRLANRQAMAGLDGIYGVARG